MERLVLEVSLPLMTLTCVMASVLIGPPRNKVIFTDSVWIPLVLIVWKGLSCLSIGVVGREGGVGRNVRVAKVIVVSVLGAADIVAQLFVAEGTVNA